MKVLGKYQAGRVLAVVLAICCSALGAAAQSRMSDRDIRVTMNNMKQDSRKFSSNFNNAIKKSTVRKTDKEKSGKAMVQTFERQIGGMLNEFESTKKVDNSLPLVIDTAGKIQDFLQTNPLGDEVNASWVPLRAELDSLSKAFGMPGATN